MTPAVRTEIVDRVLLVILARPEVRNAIDHASVEGLSRAWADAQSDEVGAVVLTGAGSAFCSGGDLRNLVGHGELAGSRLRNWLNPRILEMSGLGKPIIAAVNGVAVGAGLSLACAADIRVASDLARFIPAFIGRNLVPDTGATYFLPRLVGAGRAAHWLLSGDEIDAETAARWGLVQEVVAGDPVPRAVELAKRLAGRPSLAAGLTKELLRASATRDLAGQLDHEARLQAIALAARR